MGRLLPGALERKGNEITLADVCDAYMFI